ncbi:MAG: glycosyltransferase family 4 protein [Chloroflexaceae bacterium]|nr:glycosyltransferase family 4 protein [Chloroflexaceae bacterium]
MSTPLRVLYVCHNHPDLRPGGTEIYALALHHAMRATEMCDSLFLAQVGGLSIDPPMQRAGTRFSLIRAETHEYWFATHGRQWLSLYQIYRSQHGQQPLTNSFDEFLRAVQPDVVHFHHIMFLGYDLLWQTRMTLPHALICMTWHEYLAICHHNGQMIRKFNNALCDYADPQRCHRCFPEIAPVAFFRRKAFLQAHLSVVDRFFAPSRFLKDRYVNWGIPEQKIQHEPNGHVPSLPVNMQAPPQQVRNRFAFFGRVCRYKGIDVVLKAMRILIQNGTARKFKLRLSIFGSGLEMENEQFQDRVRVLLKQTRCCVTLHGRYHPDELPDLMQSVDWVVVPSIWWENAPLVIQESFMHRRPVICSDIGGMAEHVTHGVNGFHFQTGSAQSLAQTLTHAVSNAEQWEQLEAGIPAVRSIEEAALSMAQIYQRLCQHKQL